MIVLEGDVTRYNLHTDSTDFERDIMVHAVVNYGFLLEKNSCGTCQYTWADLADAMDQYYENEIVQNISLFLRGIYQKYFAA